MTENPYHQYHIRFDTDFRDAAHLNGESIAAFCRVVAAIGTVHSGVSSGGVVDAKAISAGALTHNTLKERMDALKMLKDMEGMYILENVRDLLLDALSEHDPQLFVDLSPGTSSMTIHRSDGTRETYTKRRSGEDVG